MATSILDNQPGSSLSNPITVASNSYPLYVNDPASQPSANPNPSGSAGDQTPQIIPLIAIPQGPGSGLNADMVDNFHAVAANVAGPNILVATNILGNLPLTVIPSSLKLYMYTHLGGF